MTRTDFLPPRRFRIFAFDPSTARAYDNRAFSEVTIALAPETDPDLTTGPTGEYFEVVDYDPASRCFYTPLDPNKRELLLNDGLTPSAEDPRFHQQMVYAVAMNTVSMFEEALGRNVLWAARSHKVGGRWYDDFVRRLRIYPHALREANAFYDPARKALLFGYFEAGRISDSAPPGTMVFTCLSHDIIVHETVHAILDGMHPRFAEDSTPDMRALHEAFSDIVAIFQLFSFPEVLKSQIRHTRGDLEHESMLGELAQEFGQSLGRSGALRSALGEVKDGKWQRRKPDRFALARARGPHDRGSILVAAVFDAFLRIYRGQVADLMRIASGGSGLLRDGDIDPDLCNRLSREAAHSAKRVLTICIRAMDYLPPMAVSFGDYLRAIVTSDHDLYPDDDVGYRDAFIDAFAAWGIVPEGVTVMSQAALLWPSLRQVADDLAQGIYGAEVPPEKRVKFDRLYAELGAAIERPNVVMAELARQMTSPDAGGKATERKQIGVQLNRNLIEGMTRDLDRIQDMMQQEMQVFDDMRKQEGQEQHYDSLTEGRPELKDFNVFSMLDGRDRRIDYHVRSYYAQLIWMLTMARATPALYATLGLADDSRPRAPAEPPFPASVNRSSVNGKPSLHVLPIRMARRIGRNGTMEREYIISLEQNRKGFFDPAVQAGVDADAGFTLAGPEGPRAPQPDFYYRAGCTMIIDAGSFVIRRLIKSAYPVDSNRGLDALRAHLLTQRAETMSAFTDAGFEAGNAFAALHRFHHTHKDGFA